MNEFASSMLCLVLLLALAGCGGEGMEYSGTEPVAPGSPASSVQAENPAAVTQEPREGDWFFKAGSPATGEQIPVEVQREFDRLADRILESEKSDPRSRPSAQAVSELEDFLRRIEPPATEPTTVPD